MYDIVKIESEEDLMKQYDDTNYQNTKPKYDKLRNKLNPFFNQEQIGKIEPVILNIQNPYTEEIVQEDLQNNRDAYKNGHDGAFLMDGDHFVVKRREQIHILGSKQDIEGFKEFVNKINAKYDAELAALESTQTPQQKSGLDFDALGKFSQNLGNTNIEKAKDDDLLKVKGISDGTFVSTREIDFIKERFGEDTVRVLANIVNSDAWGLWNRSGITLYADAPSGTGYHEAWHHFSQLFLTPSEKAQLYSDQRQSRLGLKDATLLEIEEQLAEDFRKYALSDGKELPAGIQKRNIFQKIWDFIKEFFGKRTISADKLFSDLYKNRLGVYTPSINNAMWGKLNSRIVDNKGQEIFDNRRASRYMRYMDSLFGQFMAANRYAYTRLGVSENQVGAKTVRDAGDYIKAAVINDFRTILAEEEEYFKKNNSYSARAETIQDLKKLLENFSDTYLHFVRSTKKLKSEDEKDIDFEELDTEVDPNDLSDQAIDSEDNDAYNAGERSAFERQGNEISVIDAASEETKNFIRSLSKVEVDLQGRPVLDKDGKVKLFRNNYGLNETVNFSQVFNNLAILLEGSHSFAEMINRMKSIENQKKIPELALILERLPNVDRPNVPLNELMQVSTFAKDFSKFYIPIYTLVTKVSKDGETTKTEVFFKEETKRTKDLIEKEWSTNFMNKPETDPNILRDENGRPYLNPNYRFNFDMSSAEQRDKFFDQIGFSFSNSTKNSSEFTRTIADKQYFALTTLQSTLNKRLDLGQRIYSPYAVLDREYKESKSERSILRTLAELEAKYTNQNPSMSFRNAKGTLQYGLSLTNWQTNNVYWLSKTDNYKQLIDNPSTQHLNIFNNPNIKNSVFLNRMFNLNPKSQNFGERFRVNNEAVEVLLGNYNGVSFTDETTGEQSGSSTTDLSDRAKIVMDINAMYFAGAHEVPRTESSASAFFVKLSNYNTQNGRVDNLPLPLYRVDDYNHLENNEEFAKIFRGYFEDEVASIVNKFNSKLPGYYAEYGPGRFSMFRDILGKEEADRIEKGLKDAMEGLVTPQEKQRLIDATLAKYSNIAVEKSADYLRKASDSFKKLVKNQAIATNELSSQIFEFKGRKGEVDRNFSMDEVLSNFIVNDFILNAEYIKLFAGSTAFYKAYHKRSKGDTSTGTRPLTDSFMTQFFRDTHANTLAGSIGAAPISSLNTTKTLVIKDDERKSNYTKNGIYQRELKRLNPGLSDSYIEAILKPYNNMTVADGQGHATLDFYRQFRIMVGNWQNKDEVMYRKEVIGYRKYKQLYGKTIPAEQEALDNQFLEKWADTISYFPPIKMQHNGPLKMDGTFAPVLDKFSIAPLIPSVIKGTTWEGINDELVKSGTGYIKFKSGTKKYAYPAVDFYSGNWSAKIENNQHELFTENLKEQIKTGNKVKEESTWGTQMRKLFLANAFSSGVALTPRFAEIYDRYKKLMNSVVAGERFKLYKELGITDNNGNLEVTNSESFVKTLQTQVDARNLNDNIRDSIQYDKETGKLLYPLEILNNKSAIQDLIAGMIDKRLNKIKINGAMLIQVASTGFEQTGADFSNATETDINKYGTSGLPFYSLQTDSDGKAIQTNAMGVKVALTKDFKNLLNIKHPDGEKIGTLERLNQLLKDERWRDENRQKITMIGYRIPTQGLNSIEFMEVHEFLPEVAGSIVILPAEIVAKSGSDYDIDKMSIFRPSLTDSGEIIQKNHEEKARKDLERLEREYYELRKSGEFSFAKEQGRLDTLDKLMNQLFAGLDEDADDTLVELEAAALEQRDKVAQIIIDYRNATQVRKKALTNQIIGLYKDVLSAPEMFTQLITPNDNSLVKSKANEMDKLFNLNLGDFKDTDVYGYAQNLTKFKQLLSGKRLLGAFALGNTFSQLLQQSGMTLNQVYKVEKRGKMIGHNVTLHLFNDDEIRNMIVDRGGKPVIDFSAVNNAEGIRKQEYFSQLINATVDIAADPYFSALGITNDTVGVTNYLLLMGVPFDRVIDFINQPSIRYYQFKLTQDPNPRGKTSLKGMILGTKLNRADKIQQFIEELDIKTFEAKDFTDENLSRHLKEYAFKSTGYIDNNEDHDFQKRIFAHFLKLQDQASIMTDLMRTCNFDTAKFLGATSMQNNLNLRDKVRAADLFNEKAVDKIREDSLISAFNNIEEGIQIFESVMPVGMSKMMVKASADFMANVQGLGKTQRIKLEKTLNNDWMEFIIKNFGTVDNINIERLGRQFVDMRLNGEAISDRLLRIKAQYPELSNYTLMKRLLPNLSNKQAFMKNVELYRGLDNTTDLQNVLIEEYRQLRNYSPNETYDSELTPMDAKSIQDLFADMKYAAFYQSGFGRSPISFVDIVPYEEYAQTFKQALESYQDFVKQYPDTESVIIDAFLSLFQLNNPKFAERTDLMPEGLETNMFNAEPWRGKSYFILDNSATWHQRIKEAVVKSVQNKQQESSQAPQQQGKQLALGFDTSIKGEEISSMSDNLAFALTNPVFTSPKGFEWQRNWTKGQQAWRDYMKAGINFEGIQYRDVEDAYQKNKSKYPVGLERDKFMQTLIEIKLRTYPQLVEGIKSKGGVEYLQNSTHQPTAQNSHWETGGNNGFIKALIAAYKNVTANTTQTALDIYSQLGNKTQSEHVVIDNVNGRKATTNDKIVAYRTRDNNFLEAFQLDNAIGNPWNVRGYGLYKSNSIPEAVQDFTGWLIGERHQDKLQDYRQAIVDKIQELKGKTILYYTDLGQPSHATALDYIINKYDWAENTNSNNSNIKSREELINEAISKADQVKGYYKDVFLKDPEQAMFEAAVQLHSSESEKATAIGIFGEDIARIADQLFPDAKVGDVYKNNSVDNILTKLGKTIASLGISQQEWDALSDEEKNQTKECN